MKFENFLKGLLVTFLMLSVSTVSGLEQNSKGLLIFVHGYQGDKIQTWTNAKSKTSWQNLVLKDSNYQQFKVYSFSYDTNLFGKGLDTFSLAGQLREQIGRKANNVDNVYIIAHSYGGILTMEAVRGMIESKDEDSKKIKAIFLIATPFRGTSVVNSNLAYL